MLNLGICKMKMQYLNHHVDSLTSVSKLIDKYSALFDNSQGTFTKCRISLTVKNNTVPKFFKARPVPFALKPKIDQEIDRLVRNKVLVPTEFLNGLHL